MKTTSPETLLLISIVVAIVPLLLAVGTCYLKFTIVLSLLRSGFGTQQAPSASLVMALSVVLSLVVMQPVLRETAERMSTIQMTQISSSSVIEGGKRLLSAIEPWRAFLVEHAGERELVTFARLASGKAQESEAPPEKFEDPSIGVALGAFVLSEIKRGFVIAFFLLIPFFVIDVVVSNLLVSLGLTMLSPVVVTLPLKLLLFISSDGWLLLAQSLVQSYQ